jgi:hypothetical protein
MPNLASHTNGILKALKKTRHTKRGSDRGQRQLQTEDIYNLYILLNNIRMIKLCMMERVGYVARVVEMRKAYKIVAGNLKGSNYFRAITVNSRTVRSEM